MRDRSIYASIPPYITSREDWFEFFNRVDKAILLPLLMNRKDRENLENEIVQSHNIQKTIQKFNQPNWLTRRKWNILQNPDERQENYQEFIQEAQEIFQESER